jgi:hypothetical protein
MAVTINNLSSTVSMAEGGAGVGPEVIEQIVRIVLRRLREEESAKQDQRIPERMSESNEY